MDLSAHYTALLDIAARLRVIRACFYEIHMPDEVLTAQFTGKPEPFKLDPFWIRNGIKAGLTATLALLYVNWINPPGAAALPFAAWLFTLLSRLYPGGEGDRRAFTYVIRVALLGIPYSLLLLFLTPFLADYFVMNIFLFIGLFLLGFTIARQGGISLYTQCGMLFFVGTISMNPQMPVGFQAIVDNYFGVVLALVLSSIVQRLSGRCSLSARSAASSPSILPAAENFWERSARQNPNTCGTVLPSSRRKSPRGSGSPTHRNIQKARLRN